MQTENNEFPVLQSKNLAIQIAHLNQVDRSTQVEKGDLPPPPAPPAPPAPPPPPSISWLVWLSRDRSSRMGRNPIVAGADRGTHAKDFR